MKLIKTMFSFLILNGKKILQNIVNSFKILRIFTSTLKIMINDGVEGTGVDLLQLIQDANKSVSAIHDIKIDFNSDLHKCLKKIGYKEANGNKLILIPIETTDANITIKASIYPNLIQLDIGCSSSPFNYDREGAIKLAKLLGFIHEYLCNLSLHEASIPPTGKWIMMHYHHNKDSRQTYDGERFHITCEEALNGFTRIYDKEIHGSRIIRVEQIRMPKRTVEEELEIMTQEISI